MGLKNSRKIKLLKLLINQDGFITSEEICTQLNISGRTLRDDIKKFTQEFRENGIEIVSKHGTGYTLEINDEEKYYSFIQSLLKEEENSQRILPVYPEDRVNYLIKLFLSNDDYIKLDDIAEQIFTSRSTLSNDLKIVRERLSYFHLELVSKPAYGLKVEGSEIHKRSCIAQHFFHIETIDDRNMNMKMTNEKQEKIRDILFDTLNETEFRLTDIGFQNLIIHISIALMRNDESNDKDRTDYSELKNKKEYDIAKILVNKIENSFQVQLKEQETYYITIHLLGKKTLQYNNSYTITDEVTNLMTDILEEIKDQYSIDLSSDFELFTLLALHLQPMLNRLRYGLTIQNPLLDEIKQENPHAFEISVLAANVIQRKLSYILDEAEIGYLSLHFALALERQQKLTKKRKNVIIICASGMGSSQILLYKLKQRFKDDLDEILVTELYKLKEMELEDSNFDFILSTVPIPFQTNIPVIQVQYFLTGKDILNISEALKKESTFLFIDEYFSEELFFSNIKGKTKEEVIHELVFNTSEKIDLPFNFEELVLKREAYAVTEFGNMIALPHPMNPVSNKTFVSVGILSKPIRWAKQYVKYVFLLSVKKNSTENLSLFHETIAFLVNDRMAMNRFEKRLTLDNLKAILKEIAGREKNVDSLFK